MKNHDCICNFFPVVQAVRTKQKVYFEISLPHIKCLYNISVIMTMSIPDGEFCLLSNLGLIDRNHSQGKMGISNTSLF